MTLSVEALVATVVIIFSAATWWETYTMRRFFEENVILVEIREGDRK